MKEETLVKVSGELETCGKAFMWPGKDERPWTCGGSAMNFFWAICWAS